MKKVIAYLFVLIFSVTFTYAGNIEKGNSFKPAKLTVTGYLVHENKTPVKGIYVFLFPVEDGKVSSNIVFEEGFKLGCPGGKSNSDGFFKIEFSPEYLKKHNTDEFTLGLFSVTGGPVPFRASSPSPPGTLKLNIKLFYESKKDTIDLTPITGEFIYSLSDVSDIEPAKNP